MPAVTKTRKQRVTKKPSKADVEAKVKELEAKLKAAEAKEVEKPKKGTDEPKLGTEAKPEVKEKVELPKQLQTRLDASLKVLRKTEEAIKEFKEHPLTRPGDIPVELHGIKGPGNRIGDRCLNFIAEEWKDPNIHLRWSNKQMVDYHRGVGLSPFDFDEFTEMVESRGGGHTFTRTAQNHVQIGDLILLKTSRDNYEAHSKYIREKTAREEHGAKATLYQKGDELGMEVDEGDAGPKVQRIMSLMEKEFGPGIRDHFLK